MQKTLVLVAPADRLPFLPCRQARDRALWVLTFHHMDDAGNLLHTPRCFVPASAGREQSLLTLP